MSAPESAALEGTIVELSQGLFKIKGEYLTYKDQEYMVTIANDLEHETLLIRSGRQIGKCMSPDELVMLFDGTPMRLGDLDIGSQLLSWDPETLGVVPGTFSARSLEGVREVFQLNTLSGRSIRATANHPLRTPFGWVPLSNISRGDPVLVLERTPGFGPTGWDVVTEVKSLGETETYHIQVDPWHNYANGDGIFSHNSVLQGVRIVLPCLMIPNFAALYVSPSKRQTVRFSRKALDPFCKDSDYVQTQTNTACIWSTELKQFSNKSSVTLHYAFHNADRSRGESMDLVAFDELQDLNVDNIPVIEQTLVHSKPPTGHPEWAPFFKKKMMTGTPKSLSGTIEHYWKESDQLLWTVPCRACNSYNLLTERSIGKYGTICTGNATHVGGTRKQCSRPIDPRDGFWHSYNPGATAGIRGAHISQLMVPRVEWGPHGWIRWEKDILAPYENRAPGWDKVRFFNEILGLPCESALRAVTQADMMGCCDEGWSLLEEPSDLTRSATLSAGLDWGETRSRTVLTIGGKFHDGRYAPVFVRMFEGDENDPSLLVPQILNICNLFGVAVIGCDVGHGFGLNSQLMTTDSGYSLYNVFPMRYMRTSPRLAMSSKKKHEFMVNRQVTLGELFVNIKRKRIRFPRWSQWAPIAQDFLNVFIEFSGRPGAKDARYSHGVTDRDDCLHSLNYAMLAYELMQGNFATSDETFY